MPKTLFTNKSLKGVYNLGKQLSYLLLNVHLPELSAGQKKFNNFFEDLNPPNPLNFKSLKGVYNLGKQLYYLLLDVHIPELSAGRKKFDDFFKDLNPPNPFNNK
jgi:hypothetical protein